MRLKSPLICVLLFVLLCNIVVASKEGSEGNTSEVTYVESARLWISSVFKSLNCVTGCGNDYDLTKEKELELKLQRPERIPKKKQEGDSKKSEKKDPQNSKSMIGSLQVNDTQTLQSHINIVVNQFHIVFLILNYLDVRSMLRLTTVNKTLYNQQLLNTKYLKTAFNLYTMSKIPIKYSRQRPEISILCGNIYHMIQSDLDRKMVLYLLVSFGAGMQTFTPAVGDYKYDFINQTLSYQRVVTVQEIKLPLFFMIYPEQNSLEYIYIINPFQAISCYHLTHLPVNNQIWLYFDIQVSNASYDFIKVTWSPGNKFGVMNLAEPLVKLNIIPIFSLEDLKQYQNLIEEQKKLQIKLDDD